MFTEYLPLYVPQIANFNYSKQFFCLLHSYGG